MGDVGPDLQDVRLAADVRSLHDYVLMIATVTIGGGIHLWDDRKDLAIEWARLWTGRGRLVAVVDAATLDPSALAEAKRRQALALKAEEASLRRLDE